MAFHSKHKVLLASIFLVALVIGGFLLWRSVSERVPETWLFATSNGVTFRYPETLGTTYMRGQDWPPAVRVLLENYACTEAGSAIDRAGRTESRIINLNEYCVTEKEEGAAGSIYTQYAYAYGRERGKTLIFTFSVQASQCANYPGPQMSECLAERRAFDIDRVADLMIQSADYE